MALKKDTIVKIVTNGEAFGKIVGVTFESVLAGNFYIIKLLKREGQAWIDYPFDYVVLPENAIKGTDQSTLDALRDIHVLKAKNSISEDDVVTKEQKLRDAVEALIIDTPHVRSFLEKAGKEYLKVFDKKGIITKVHPVNFVVEIETPEWGTRRIRVPIKDFFVGKSSVAEADREMHKMINSIGYSKIFVRTDIPNRYEHQLVKSNPEETVRIDPGESKEIVDLLKKIATKKSPTKKSKKASSKKKK